MAAPGRDEIALAVAAIEGLIEGEIPEVADVPAVSLDLVERVRDLVEAAVRTDVGPDARAAAAALVDRATELLKAATHDEVVRFARTADGRIDQLTQAGSGALNPQAPRLVFREPPRPAARVHAATDGPRAVELVADCRLTAAHSGPPGRAHGGVVATILDHVLGIAAAEAGAPGFTGGLEVRYRAATPYDVPLEIRARWTHSDGRKSFATGEVLAEGRVTAEATAVFVAPRDNRMRLPRAADPEPEAGPEPEAEPEVAART
ncbi:MAG: PaaI family thioesterase [Streptomycetaceae bacterium]|nr:PaaI family thioesterase [Streptomycetaceae bacterium]